MPKNIRNVEKNFRIFFFKELTFEEIVLMVKHCVRDTQTHIQTYKSPHRLNWPRSRFSHNLFFPRKAKKASVKGQITPQELEEGQCIWS